MSSLRGQKQGKLYKHVINMLIHFQVCGPWKYVKHNGLSKEYTEKKGIWVRGRLACSRLRDGGGKSFSKKKCEKRAGAGER